MLLFDFLIDSDFIVCRVKEKLIFRETKLNETKENKIKVRCAT